MNKYLRLFTGAILLTGLTVAATPAEDMLAAAEKSEDGLVAMAEKANNTVDKDGKKILDPVAYEALFLAFQFAEPNARNYDLGGYPFKALSKIRRNYKMPSIDEFLPRMLAHPSPKIRANALSYIRTFLGVSKTNLERTNDMLTNEKDPVVIAAMVRALANEGDRNPAVGAFLVRCLDNPDPVVRYVVGIHSPSSWNYKNQALADKLADLIVNEKDENTRKYICEYAGRLNNDAIVDAYSKVIFTETDPQIQNAAIKGLLLTWWCYPLHNTDRQKGYELSLKFFREFKPNSRVPSTSAIFPLTSSAAPSKSFEKWKEKATWYKPEDVAAVFLPYATDKDYPKMLRQSAIKILAYNGYTKEQVQELVTKLAADGLLSKFDVSSLERFIKGLK